MWLIATPIQPTATDQVLLNVRMPDITRVYDETVPLKRRAVSMVERQCASVQLNLLDTLGRPVNLQEYGFITNDEPSQVSSSSSMRAPALPSSSSSSESSFSASPLPTGNNAAVVARYRESTLMESSIYEVTSEVIDIQTGLVRVRVPNQVATDAGIYTVEVGVLNADRCLLFTNTVFIYNETSGWGGAGLPGPPALDDIRLSLRDNDPYDNLLLDNFDFDLAEICHAALRTVQFWNDQPPPVAAVTTKTMPFRDIWLEGIQYFLFRVAEEHYRRNALRHSAGGTQIDDKARWQDYNHAWRARFDNFKRMVVHRKAQINAEGGFSSLRSGYSRNHRHSVVR